MIKHVQELTKKTAKELEKEAQTIRQDIAKSILERVVQPIKDTNSIQKKRRQLAVIMTVISGNKTVEPIKTVKARKTKTK